MPIGGRAYLLHRLAWRAAVTGDDSLEQEESAGWFAFAALASACTRMGGVTSSWGEGSPRRWRTAVEYAARVEELLAGSFRERLTLAAIGRAVDCSPFHLSRLVRRATGLPIHRLLLRRRLRHALDLVLDSRDGLAAIAGATGFSSHSHLTDSFRREFGVSPDAVRRGLGAISYQLAMSWKPETGSPRPTADS